MRKADFPPERIERIRAALIAAGHREEPVRNGNGKVSHYAHFDEEGHQDSDACLSSAPGYYKHSDLPMRASECIQSLNLTHRAEPVGGKRGLTH